MSDSKGEGEGQPLLPKRRQRNVTVLSLVAITYFAVAGGPEGTETLIQTAGPLYSILGFVVVGVLWSVPMALMSAELTTAFPENGGYVLWVTAAFGQQAGEMAGWLQFVSSGVDACIYPGLFLVYLEEALDMDLHDPTTAWTIKITFVVLLLVLNVLGIESVGHGSTLFMIALLSPFVVIILLAFTGVFTGTTVTGWPFSTADMIGTPPNEPDWTAFLMVLLWNMGYWEGASVCAGEVANVGTVFPLAIAISMVVVLLNYILPIMAFSVRTTSADASR
jgi:amino acid transporter